MRLEPPFVARRSPEYWCWASSSLGRPDSSKLANTFKHVNMLVGGDRCTLMRGHSGGVVEVGVDVYWRYVGTVVVVSVPYI